MGDEKYNSHDSEEGSHDPMGEEEEFLSSNHELNYENYEIHDKNEKVLLSSLIYMIIDKEGRNCTKAQKKIINLARVWLEKPEIVFFEEKALIIDEIQDPFYFRQFFDYLQDSTIICFVKGFGSSYHMNVEEKLKNQRREQFMNEQMNKFEVDPKNQSKFKEFYRKKSIMSVNKSMAFFDYFDKFIWMDQGKIFKKIQAEDFGVEEYLTDLKLYEQMVGKREVGWDDENKKKK